MLRYLSEDVNDALEPFWYRDDISTYKCLRGKTMVYHRRKQYTQRFV